MMPASNFLSSCVAVGLLFLLFTSCASRKSAVYFQPDDSEILNTNRQYQPKIQPGDVISINVSASDPKAVLPFNLSGEGNEMYTVDDEGYVLYPQLGRIKLLDLTRLEAIALLKEKLRQYVADPGVNITFVNFKVTVVGDVRQPGTFTSPTDRITVIEAIALAGDMQMTGVRNNVLVLREVGGKKTMHRIDLTKQAELNSPYYYLMQNDVVYVEPNNARLRLESGLREHSTMVISIVTLLVTLYSILK